MYACACDHAFMFSIYSISLSYLQLTHFWLHVQPTLNNLGKIGNRIRSKWNRFQTDITTETLETERERERNVCMLHDARVLSLKTIIACISFNDYVSP